MVSKVLFSSETGEWETPQDLFDKLNTEYCFTIDVAATPENAKCPTFITKEQDALTQPWHGRVWCNPPYGRGIVTKWVEKATEEYWTGNAQIIVMLLPARTDTKWFHEYVYGAIGVDVGFIRGRLKFGGAKNSAPFPSMLVYWGCHNSNG